jgi:hypothetical protein
MAGEEGGEGQTGRCPYEGEAGPAGTKAPEASGSAAGDGCAEEEREGKVGREKLPTWFRWEGEPERSKRPRRARVPTRINRSGSKEGYGFWGERKSLERRIEAGRVSMGSAGAEEMLERAFRSP